MINMFYCEIDNMEKTIHSEPIRANCKPSYQNSSKVQITSNVIRLMPVLEKNANGLMFSERLNVYLCCRHFTFGFLKIIDNTSSLFTNIV